MTREPLMLDGVNSADGGFVVVIDGRVVFDGVRVARFTDRDEAQRFYDASVACACPLPPQICPLL